MKKTRILIFIITVIVFTTVSSITVKAINNEVINEDVVDDSVIDSSNVEKNTILHYNFDQASLSISDVQDISGNGHIGKGVGLEYGKGSSGQGLMLDRNKVRYVRVEHSDDFNLKTFSIEADVKFNLPEEDWPFGYQTIASIEGQYILRAGHGRGEGRADTSFFSAILFYRQGHIISVNLWEDEFKFEPDRWYSIKYIYDGEYIKLFVDNNLIEKKSAPITQYTPVYSSNPLYIGNHKMGSGPGNPGLFDAFIGTIDNFRISSISVEGLEADEDIDEEVDNVIEKPAPIDNVLTNKLKGKILLQVEDRGQAWYVKPDSGKRVYMQDGKAAYNLMRNEGLGITNTNLNKIPIGTIDKSQGVNSDNGLSNQLKKDNSLVNKVKGKILLQVEEKGEAWYVNPDDGKRYYMKDGDSAYQVMKFLSLGINNSNLEKIAED